MNLKSETITFQLCQISQQQPVLGGTDLEVSTMLWACCDELGPKQTAAVRTAAVCVTSLLLIYKLLQSGYGSGSGSGCGQAAVWT